MEANTSLNEYLEKTSQLIREVFCHPPKVTLSEIQGFDYEGTSPEEEGVPVSFSAISVVGLWYAHPLNREDIATSAWRLDKIDPEDGMLVGIGEWDTFEETLFQIIVSIAAQFGDIAIAVFALTRRTENIVNQATRGLGRAAGALAGQNLGAGLVGRAKSSMGWALVYAIGFEIPIILGLMLFPDAVAQFINGEPEFIATGAKWIFIAALGYISMGLVQVFTQGFNTSGAMVAPMIITVSTMWLFEIPLAFALATYTSLGQFGVPWAIVAGMTLRLVFFTAYYLGGKWLRTGLL